ncbi:tetratricopeptide repeat protein [Solitalea lacus]|uniref:tetratricopeptide repeat protein n=1 Tax=Solitalea lacus TaxID=2911172 RepID=UPI001ED9EA59|nr:tetratricopeptide repeat protein [Solitalea lacus]UKJ07828.1 tetratricopeptide repeat protein [Solitalea lacus]
MNTPRLLFCFLLIIFSNSSALAQDDLTKYVNRLKKSQTVRGEETAFMTAGSSFMYGWENYELKKYEEASWKFEDAMNKQSDNAFATYMYAISLIKQNDTYKTQKAQAFLQKAFNLNPSLKDCYNKEFPATAPKPADTLSPKNDSKDGLDAYIERMKYSKATGGEETRFLTPGNNIIGGIEYFEGGNYHSAQTQFELAVNADGQTGFSNYLLAISMIAQGKTNEAKPYLNKAFSLNPHLKNRYGTDADIAQKKHVAYRAKRDKETFGNIKPFTKTKETGGGVLIFGKYACTQTVYNGNYNAQAGAPTFSNIYKGNFELKADGTYRWLDNGETGRYNYNKQTGEIKWLSGYFATLKPQSSIFQPASTGSQITVNFSNSYRWECGCNKK